MLKPFEDVLLVILNFFYQYVQNYGVAIILLTVAVRIFLLPLTIKQTKSMQAMQKIQPKLKKLQEKYKDDKEKLQKEMMKFYAEHKVNPLSGCLPLIVQLPIFFALYRMLLSNGANLKGQGFLWLQDLSRPEPAPYILIVLMMVSTYLSSKTMSADPQQEKMMLPMTIFIAFIAIKLPAGVLVYWVTTNILTVVQQYATLKLSAEKGKAGGEPLVVEASKDKEKKT